MFENIPGIVAVVGTLGTWPMTTVALIPPCTIKAREVGSLSAQWGN